MHVHGSTCKWTRILRSRVATECHGILWEIGARRVGSYCERACFLDSGGPIVLSQEEAPVFTLCPNVYQPFSAPRIIHGAPAVRVALEPVCFYSCASCPISSPVSDECSPECFPCPSQVHHTVLTKLCTCQSVVPTTWFICYLPQPCMHSHCLVVSVVVGSEAQQAFPGHVSVDIRFRKVDLSSSSTVV